MVVTLIPLPTSGTNYSIIDANKAQALDGPALDKLMRVNGADEVYVLDAVYTEDGLEVQATSYSGNTTTIKAVSYSHLDVYKRQPQIGIVIWLL